MHHKRRICPGIVYERIVVFDGNARLGEQGVVIGTVCVEVLGVVLGGSIAPVQVILKKNGNFRYNRQPVTLSCSNFNSADEVFLSVCPEHSYWELRTGKNNRLGKPFKHEA